MTHRQLDALVLGLPWQRICAKCETLVQAPVAPHIIDKGIPTAGPLAQVLVAKFLDHLPLYRQERIFERVTLPRFHVHQKVGNVLMNGEKR